MYFRIKKSPSGETLQLLESYRNSEGASRNRVVVSLGSMNLRLSGKEKRELAKHIESRLKGQNVFFESENRRVNELADIIVKRVEREGRWSPLQYVNHKKQDVLNGVIRSGISHRNSTTLGPELLCIHAWNRLKMDQFLRCLKFNSAQVRSACALLVSRVISPGSELGIQRFLNTSSLPDLLDHSFDGRGELERFYRVGDKLLKHSDDIELHLRQEIRSELNLERTYLLYDLTNTHFEGICAGNPKALRGNNKQKRNDCPQITAGLCFDEHGFVLFHKIFPGNTNDSATLKEMLLEMEKCSEEQNLLSASIPATVILDGGIATEENLDLLMKSGFQYLVNRTRKHRVNYESDFKRKDDFKKIKTNSGGTCVYAKKIRREKNTIVLCYSEKRAGKEHGIMSKIEEKFLENLKALRERISKGRLKKSDKILKAIGRLHEKYSRAAKYYEISLLESGNIQWDRKSEQYEKAGVLEGCYVLETNVPDMTEEQLWRRYITLTTAENGFRILKSNLGLRPNFHHNESRVDGHVFITILAYQLLRFITWQLEYAGETRSWPLLKQLLSTHTYTTVDTPTTEGFVYRDRKPGTAESCQKEIYNLLNIDYANLPVKQSILPSIL